MLAAGWRLFEQRRPAAAEKEFRAALALKPDWPDAMVAIGLARLRSGDQDAARREFNEVLRVSEKLAAELRESGAKDAFSRKEAQAYLRASHALGCLAFDQERYQDALADLERVYGVDQGAVGTEARLIAGAALLKLKRPADAVQVLEVASKSEAGQAARCLVWAWPTLPQVIGLPRRLRCCRLSPPIPTSEWRFWAASPLKRPTWVQPQPAAARKPWATRRPSAMRGTKMPRVSSKRFWLAGLRTAARAVALPAHPWSSARVPKEPASPVLQERRASRRNPIQVRLQLADLVSSFLGRSVDVSRAAFSWRPLRRGGWEPCCACTCWDHAARRFLLWAWWSAVFPTWKVAARAACRRAWLLR